MKTLKITLMIFVVIVLLSLLGIAHMKLDLPPEHFAGQCETLELNESAEDMQIDRERGFVYLSLIDRQTLAKGGDVQGWIGRLDLNSGSHEIEPALIDPPSHFRPHGLSLYIDPNGERTMAVINHPVNRGEEPEHVMLLREEQPGRFRFVRTFTDELIKRPNDLVVVGPEQYYVANDSPPNSGETTNLVYIDADKARVVQDNIRSGGGINASLDGNMIFVAETGGNAIRVLKRNPIEGSVETVAEIDLGTAPDNIDVAADGSLWVGAHSSLFGLVLHFILRSNAPSQVLHV